MADYPMKLEQRMGKDLSVPHGIPTHESGEWTIEEIREEMIPMLPIFSIQMR